MRRLAFAQLTQEDLAGLATVTNHGLRRQPWEEMARGELTDVEMRHLQFVSTTMRRVSPSLVNEATVWARAIYPLLVLAESESCVAQADVPLLARIGDVELAGSADGAFGTPIDGELWAPFLIVVEAKRGVEGRSPVLQLHAELLAAAWINAKASGEHVQRIHGCYTVADNWTFVRADLAALDTARPTLSIVSSWEMNEKVDAPTIIKILKSIVAAHQREAISPRT